MRKPRLTPEIIAASYKQPEFYFRQVLGLHVTGYQKQIAESVRDNPETAARSANGVGKSYLAGMLMSWWFDTVPDGGAFVGGPKFAQSHRTYRAMCAMRAGAKYELPGVMQATEMRMGGYRGVHWWVKPVTAKDPESFAGMHETRMLAVMEEASGIPDEIYAAAYGCVTGERDRVLHIGNPTRPVGLFANLWKQKGVTTFSISAYDCPNVKEGREVIPGLVGRLGVERLVTRFGADSDTVRVRVHGLPPVGSGNGIFGFQDIEDAKVRGRDAHNEVDGEIVRTHPTIDPIHVGGMDVAREGDDKCCIVRITDGVVMPDIDVWEKSRTTTTIARAAAWLERWKNSRLNIDTGTFGAAVFDNLVERFGHERIHGTNFGGTQVLGKFRTSSGEVVKKAKGDERKLTPYYWDRRTELWCEAADWTRAVGMFHPGWSEFELETLEADLLAPEIDPSAIGPIKMERKAETKKRLGRSPDYGDAYCLAVAELQGITRSGPPLTLQMASSVRSRGGVRMRGKSDRLSGYLPAGRGLEDW